MQTPPPDDVWKYIMNHLLVFAPMVAATIAATAAVSSFLFKLVIDNKTSTIELKDSQLAKAVEEVERLKLRLKEQVDEVVPPNPGQPDRAGAFLSTLGDFFANTLKVLALVLLIYNVYLQQLLVSTSRMESTQNQQFREDTRVAMQSINKRLQENIRRQGHSSAQQQSRSNSTASTERAGQEP